MELRPPLAVSNLLLLPSPHIFHTEDVNSENHPNNNPARFQLFVEVFPLSV